MTDFTAADLRLAHRQTNQLSSNRDIADLFATFHSDLEIVSGRENLAQALINRLQTRLGELAELGHPDYGSRLHELGGEPNNNRTRAFAELYIRESLIRDSRVQEVTEVVFEPPDRHRDRHTLKARVTVLPVAAEELVTVAVDVNLEA